MVEHVTVDRHADDHVKIDIREIGSVRYFTISLLLFAIAVRAAVGLHPYSGEKTPPMFGDYEAQRHWMEVSLYIPPQDWYSNTPDNDLSYWGLDYPPLSGYASFVFGKLLGLVDSDAIILHSSRGYESPMTRQTMRATVLIADFLLFFPAVLLLIRHLNSSLSKRDDDCIPEPILTFASASFTLSAPALLLIDHAHFQYNNVSLGLFLLAIVSFLRRRDGVGAALFCMSIYFKQMNLYYALAVLFYLVSRLARMLAAKQLLQGLSYGFRILTAIIATTVVCFMPWLSSRGLFLGMLRRIFPVSRGLYEDKVANVWCSISILIKLNRILGQEQLILVCGSITVLASLPFCIAVASKPSATRLLLGTCGCSLAAFLFSFQVHEKQILLPLVPLAVLSSTFPNLALWMSLSSTFSIFPLLLREGSTAAYIMTIGIHMITVAVCGPKIQPSLKQPGSVKFAIILAFILGSTLNVLMVFCKPPEFAPDMFVLLNTIYACAHLCLIYISLVWFSFASS